ncbi:MAG: autotransporter outer membrane beta-barrel domain-containing protein [Phascolarctobacterium sp.]|uniref:autotransporter outer membrane beta-barrel domain-containing protein n=1 Tax=Phascolarctobacterium sp. TaxID=2049039 RepID=UPI002600D472|nr:autotransporter outer membrane beta-barrel domain-containing protein [Phascolarctobacterium sp.]MCC8158254.1 autotransporter outer membrane beta-barrel domain-containing protein [Phascolarctobacterium sp.]
MKGKFLVLAVTLSLTGAASAPVWAANTGGTSDSPATGDYAGKVVTEATGAADNQSVAIDTNVTQKVYGGYISNSGNTDSVSGNSVTVTADIGSLLYGGYTKGTGAASDNIIHVNGNVNSGISGGKTSGNNADNNKIYITGGTIGAAVIGGESGTSSTPDSQANNNEIYITAIDKAISINHSGNFHVIGGSARKTAAGNKIFIGSDNDRYDIEMGENGAIGGEGKQVTNNQITVGSANGNNNIKLKFVYGAWVTGAYEGCYGEGNSVLIQNDNATIRQEVHGAFGNGKLASLRNNSVIIKAGTFAKKCWITGAYGEGCNTEITGNSIDISGGTFADDVLVVGGLVLESYNGAGDGNANVVGNRVRVSGVTMPVGTGAGGIYGGYSKKNGNLEKNEVIIEEEVGKLTAINVMISGAVNESTGAAELKENKVIINGGTLNKEIYGAYTEGTGAATGNSVTISGGTLNKEIYGAYTESGAATGNAINIKGNNGTAPTFADDVVLYGGFSNSGGSVSGNKLNLYTKGISVGDIKNFDNYNFYLPEDMAAGETVLTLKGNNTGLDLSGSTVNIGVLGSAPVLKLNEEVTLIHNADSTITEGNVAYGKLQQGVSIVYDFETMLKNGDHDLVTKVTNIAQGTTGTTEQSKSPVETQTAELGFLNSGSDLLVGKGILDAVRVAAVGEKNNPIFGAANAGKMRYKSGSHADVTGYNIVLGTAKTVNNSFGQLTYGPFIEGGWGSYSTYLDSGIRGDGNTKYYGLGLFVRQDNKNGIYYEGSVRYGRLEADYASGDMIGAGGSAVFSSYDSSSAYYGAHFGVGKVSALNETVKADVYAKLLYNHQNGDSAALGGEGNGEVYDFDAVDSMRARIGGRVSKDYGVSTTGYVGLSYEYEFDGEARASVKGFSTPSPSIKGSSGMFEVGYIWQPKDANDPAIDLGLQGWTGKKQGLTANVNFVWKF